MLQLTEELQIDAASARLRRLYGDAPRGRVARGKRWYPTAARLLREEAAAQGYTLAQALAVLAITSPQCHLETNVRWTVQALRTRGAARVGRYPNTMRPKILAVLADPKAAARWASGPKVSVFLRALLGDLEAVTLDRWALLAALGDNSTSPRAADRRAADAAYRRVAAELGMSPRDLQAAIWIQIRETTPDSRGRIRRLQDVHDLVRSA